MVIHYITIRQNGFIQHSGAFPLNIYKTIVLV